MQMLMFLLFSLPCLQLSFVCPAASRGNLPRSLKLNPLDAMGGDLLLLTFPRPPTHTNQSGLTSLKTLFTVPAATISQFLNPSSQDYRREPILKKIYKIYITLQTTISLSHLTYLFSLPICQALTSVPCSPPFCQCSMFPSYLSGPFWCSMFPSCL